MRKFLIATLIVGILSLSGIFIYNGVKTAANKQGKTLNTDYVLNHNAHHTNN